MYHRGLFYLFSFYKKNADFGGNYVNKYTMVIAMRIGEYFLFEEQAEEQFA